MAGIADRSLPLPPIPPEKHKYLPLFTIVWRDAPAGLVDKNRKYANMIGMTSMPISTEDRVIILGATGFVGRRLIPCLLEHSVKLRLLVRDPAKVRVELQGRSDVEIVRGDILETAGLEKALEGIHTAYYLIHSMGGKSLFRNVAYARKDQRAARNFLDAAGAAGLKRIIYLGALGEEGPELSEHLKSRAEVARILASGSPEATVLRAAIIIGAGGASYEMLRYLVERLPIMGCPKWIDTRIQPIAIRDVLAYLAQCLFYPETAGETLDIGGPEILTYREMMHQYAEARNLPPRIIFRVPFLTPLLSAYWVDLVTPIPSGVAHPLIEGMRSEVICRDDRIRKIIPMELTGFRESVRIAFSEAEGGPGKRGC
jgi:uncharacterized protein YbjT (DUF2867 family)